MADLDIKDAEKVNTLADTDCVTVLVDNLLKHIPASRLYELLAKKIPVVTDSTSGIITPEMYAKWKIHQFKVPPTSEVDTGLRHSGIIQVTTTNFTGTASVGVMSSNSSFITPLSDPIIKFTEEGNAPLIVAKRQGEGNIIIMNKSTSTVTFLIRLF